MSAITVQWAGGEHDFLLDIGQLRALQQRCDAGPAFVLNRLRTGAWHVDDVLQTIRLGLIGGGMDKGEAGRLVAKHVEERPITLSVITAQLILMAALYGGDEDDEVGKAPGETEETPPTPPQEESGDSPTSTAEE